MKVIESSEQSKHMGQPRKNYRNVQYLVAVPVDVIFQRPQLLRNPGSVNHRTRQIEQSHQAHPIDAHAPILYGPAMQQNSVRDKDHGGKPKTSVHGCAVRSKGRMSESGVQGCDYAEYREDGDVGPVDFLEWRIAVETVVDARDGGSPHQDDDSEVIKLVAEPLHVWAMVADDVVCCR